MSAGLAKRSVHPVQIVKTDRSPTFVFVTTRDPFIVKTNVTMSLLLDVVKVFYRSGGDGISTISYNKRLQNSIFPTRSGNVDKSIQVCYDIVVRLSVIYYSIRV